MQAQRRCFPVVLVAMVAVAGLAAALWSGCTFFSAPLSADAGVNATVTIGQSITLQGSAAGGLPPYSYSWTPAAGLNNASIAQPVFTPTTVGTRVFTLTVTDALGATAFASVSITAQSSSPALVANAGPDLSTTVNVPVMLQGSASGGNGLYSYAWSAPAGVTLQGANTATPVFTPTTAGTFVFTLTVTDTEGTSATDTMSVTVAGQEPLTSLTWAADFTTGGYRAVAVFAQALAKSSAETTANYRVTGTSTTPTSASLGADNRTVTLTFDVALASTSQFDLSVNNRIQDAGGNPIPAILGRTPDRNTADTTPPAVTSAAWGPLISGGYQVSVVFTEALDRTSAQALSAYRVTGTGTVAHSATLGGDGKTVTVVFTGVTLTSSSHIDIGVGGTIRDINGNAMAESLNHAVSGTISTQTTVSTVTWGANYAAGGYQVLVTFNQAVDATTAQKVDNWRITGGTTKPASATRSADGKTVTLVFAAALAITDKLDISVGDSIKDANGNAIAEQTGHTIAAASGDAAAPTISSVTWAANYASGGYQVIVVFSEAMDRASVEASTGWRINGTTTTPSSVTLGTDGKTATLAFLAPLAIANKLDVSVGGSIRDINANVLAQSLGQAIAAAADVTVPTLSSVNWAAHYGTGGYQVLVVFSEAMDEATAETAANYAINPGAAAPTSATLQADGKTVALVFAGIRHSTDTLDISIGDTIKDINGNAAAASPAHAIAANTADTTGPNIASRYWKSGVLTYQAVVTFSDALDETSAETVGNYSMTVNGGAAINPTTATLAADGVTVTLDFGNVAVFKTADLLTVSAAVKNVNLRANTSTTAAAMTAVGGTRQPAASFVWVAPPASYEIVLTFAEVMDKASTTATANYTLGALAANPATATLAADGVTLTLTWTTGPFAATDQLAISANVKNIRGESKAETVAVASGGGAGPSIVTRTWGANQPAYKAIVVFDQVMDKTSAEAAANYNLGGATGTAASLAADGKTVTVTFATGALNAADTLTVAGAVHNINGVANTSVAAVGLAANGADVTAPIPTSAVKVDATHVDVTFSEVIDKATAEAAAYTITGGAVTAAALQPGGLKVRLTTTVDPAGKTVTVPATVTDVNGRAVAVATPVAVP